MNRRIADMNDYEFIEKNKSANDHVEVDINALIDDAMTKKDRSVHVFISPSGTSIFVTPYPDVEPEWIKRDDGYMCGACGNWSLVAFHHCPMCGEEIKPPKWNESKKQGLMKKDSEEAEKHD